VRHTCVMLVKHASLKDFDGCLQPWWFRRDPVSYFPAFSKGDCCASRVGLLNNTAVLMSSPGDESVKAFLSHHGWSRLSVTKRRQIQASLDHCDRTEFCTVTVFLAKWLRANFRSILPWIGSTVFVGLFVLPLFSYCDRKHLQALREKLKTD
jgi:hypothetical protein